MSGYSLGDRYTHPSQSTCHASSVNRSKKYHTLQKQNLTTNELAPKCSNGRDRVTNVGNFQAKTVKKQGDGITKKTKSITAGTGVFLPLYCSKIHYTTGDDLNNNGGRKEEDNQQQRDYDEEIPIEKLLPSEWTY
uniref:uncharacterized protein LOC122606263 n=1 Tax=Erigeron canadensis TaxID=72917 RepID=UPI001CB8998B|nr:uncharacterized protein LOC122606263 [Erigeron canadensis]